MQWIADQHGSRGSAADDEQFGGLEQDFDIAMLHEITAEHGPENNDDSNHGKHCGL